MSVHATDQLTLDALNERIRRAQVDSILAPSRSIQARFEAWLNTVDGQYIYDWIRFRALNMKRQGWKHYGIKPIWEAARYARDVQVGPEGGFKLNDHFTSRMARRIMADNPELEGFFEVRTLRA